MKDRIPKYANRVKLNPVAGQPNTYDIERADEPIQDGTPLNKLTLLSDETAAEMGLGEYATPNDAFSFLINKASNLESELEDVQDQIEPLLSSSQIAFGSYVGTGNGGQSNKNSLTFNFVPKILFLVRDASVDVVDNHGGNSAVTTTSEEMQGISVPSLFWVDGITSVKLGAVAVWSSGGTRVGQGTRYFVANGNTIQWYSSMVDDDDGQYYVNVGGQMNISGHTYKYIAIG